MKFGIIGSNFVVDNFFESANLIEDFEFISMYSRDINKEKEFGNKYGGKYFFDDLDEMFNSDIVKELNRKSYLEEKILHTYNTGSPKC